jgi:hypothetical protein
LGASPVGGASARIERFFASWFVTAEATTSQAAKDFIGRVPAMITSGQFDVVATTLQTMPKEDLHVSFSTIAAEGWERSASFWEQAWRLARFFERVSNGSLMAWVVALSIPIGWSTAPQFALSFARALANVILALA